MAFEPLAPFLASLGTRPVSIVLAAGLLILFVLLAVLVWTRFGQARPIAKCAALSVLAHALLLIYAYSTHVLYGPPGVWYGQTVKIRLHDAADDEEAAPIVASEPSAWQQSGDEEVPLAVMEEPEEKPPSEAELAAHAPAETAEEPAKASSPMEVAAVPEPPAPPAAEEPMPAAAEAKTEREVPALVDLLDQPAAAEEALPPAPEPAPKETAESAAPSELVSAAKPAPPPLAPVPRRLGDGQEVPETLRARVAADRLKVAQPFGASPQTENAVTAALAWLAAAQSPDGRWDADAFGAGKENRTLDVNRQGAGARADTGITGLALLAFLGRGQTHLQGEHAEVVQHGLEFLLASQAADGNLAGEAELFAAMYSHGIAMLAVSEAYALSGDDRLLPHLKRALRYTIDAQHPGGGWRYRPYDSGDMSQFGWQLMALKSAELGGIPIPSTTRSRMGQFLRSCSLGRSKGLASYRPAERASRTMTAEALVCRFFLEAENSPSAADEAAAFLMAELPGTSKTNFYYWYYGTLALYQRQGPEWQRWNGALTHELLSRQRWDGAALGSWDPDELWGCYGGRVFSTALGALCLEVYYRYLPLYQQQADELRFTDLPGLPALPR